MISRESKRIRGLVKAPCLVVALASLTSFASLVACEATPAPVAPVAPVAQDNADNAARLTPGSSASSAAANSAQADVPTPPTPPKPSGAKRWCAASQMAGVAGSPPPERCETTRAKCEQLRMMVRVPLGECEPRGGDRD